MYRYLFSLIAGITFSTTLTAATIDLVGDASEWAIVMDGSRFDVAGDQQASSSELELVGGAGLPLLYTQYDDNNTPGDTTDDTVAYRVRVSGMKTTDYSAGYLFLGFDLNLDGALDFYLSVSGKSNDGGMVGWDPGTDLNTSPSTTSITNPTPIAALDFTAGTGNVSFVPVDATTNSAIDPNFDSDATNGVDYFLSFKLAFDEFKTVAEAKSGITGITPQTSIQYTLATSTNPNSYTSDVGGYNDNTDDMSVSYADAGAFSPATSLSNIYPVITSNGGGDTATVVVEEGTTSVTTVSATDANGDPITYSLSTEISTSNEDRASFSIGSVTGELSFISSPVYDPAGDVDSNNNYQVIVLAEDGAGGIDSQAITVTVTARPNIPGTVIISGNAGEGETLTASVSDSDGTTTSTISYQWYADGVAISGATSSSYLLTQSEVGKVITVTASYTDDGGTAESPTSGATAAVSNTNETGSVTISGSASEGETLTATVSDNDGTSTSSISYQWYADGVAISGATSSSYLLTQSEVGKVITVTASYTDDGGTAENPTSSSTAVVTFNSANDADGDGISNGEEGIWDTDGDGIADYLDLDSDNDGIPDSFEGAGDSDSDGVADWRDLDSDNDGIYDLVESGILDPLSLDSDNDGRIDNGNSVGANGLADSVETIADSGSLNYTVADSDGDLIEDFRDRDSDNDGLFDITESNGIDEDNDGVIGSGTPVVDSDGLASGAGLLPVDADNDGVADLRDLDSDNDGIFDVIEADGTDANGDGMAGDDAPVSVSATGVPVDGGLTPVDTDGDGVPDQRDRDSDNDGIPDVTEAGGSDGDGDGIIGTGTPIVNSKGITEGGGLVPVDTDDDGVDDQRDLDSDNDGISDLEEAGGSDINGDGKVDGFVDNNGDGFDDGLSVTPLPIPDSDYDGIPDFQDMNDSDNDGIADIDDMDDDNDGIPDAQEGDGSVDSDNDGIPDSLDLDSDNDGIYDLTESGVENPGSLDSNGDGRIDDSNSVGGNGLADVVESSPDSGSVNYNGGSAVDSDGDGVADFRDLDSDNDGIPDVTENGGSDPDNDGIIGSGTPVVNTEGVAAGTRTETEDTDADGIPNYLDSDSDGDGISDLVEAGGSDTDGDGVVDGFTDSNGDGYDDSLSREPLPLVDSDGNGKADYLQVERERVANPIGTGVQGAGGCSVAFGSPFDPVLPLLLLASLIAVNRKKILSVVKGGAA